MLTIAAIFNESPTTTKGVRSASQIPAAVLLLAGIILSASACSGHTGLDRHTTAVPSSEPDELDELDALDELDRLDSGSVDDPAVFHDSPSQPEWQERSFSGHTVYTVSEDESGTVKGQAQGTASLLYRQENIDVTRFPWLNWRWKISNTYGELDERTRAGDDFPARIYVVVQTGALPWETRAVNYVWSSNSTVGDSWENPFTDKAKMLVLQSGEQHAGEWRNEKRDVVADFKALFDLDITKLSGYAVMVDGDNSGSSGTGWFSDIHFREN